MRSAAVAANWNNSVDNTGFVGNILPIVAGSWHGCMSPIVSVAATLLPGLEDS